MRKKSLRKSFAGLADGFIDLKRHMTGLGDLLSSNESFHSPVFRFQVRQHLKGIKASFRKCDHNARGGMTWAIKCGVPAMKAESALDRIYLRHLSAVSKSFTIVDQLLNSQGMQCSMADLVNRTKARWEQDLLFVKSEELAASATEKLTADADFYCEAAL